MFIMGAEYTTLTQVRGKSEKVAFLTFPAYFDILFVIEKEEQIMFKVFQHLQWVVVLVAIVLVFAIIEDIAAEKWEVISELPTHRRGFSTAVVNGKIYLIGGTLFENRRGPYGLSTVEVYDPQRNTWHRGADMPTPRMGPKTAVVDGIIYVLGGYNAIDNRAANVKHLDIVEAYNPQNDTWVRKQDMSAPRIQFGISPVAGKIYTIGGAIHFFDIQAGEPGRLKLVEVYDPATDTSTKRANMPTRRDGSGVGVVQNRIYAIGGRGWPQFWDGGPFLTTIEEYNPKTNRWRKKNEILNLRISFSTVSLGDVIYLIGGSVRDGGLSTYLATVDVYNPETEEWSDIPSMPIPITPFGAAGANGKIYVFGGRGENRELFTDVLMFDTGFRAVEAMNKLSTRWGELKSKRTPQP